MCNNSTIHIALSSDENYVKQMSVVITSALQNKGVNDNLFFHVLDGGVAKSSREAVLSLQNKSCKIEFLSIDDSLFNEDMPLGEAIPHVTKATYYRYLLSSLLPKNDKILYLDVDIIILGSLAELYNTDVSDYYVAGAKDILFTENTKRLKVKKYCNAGVLLFNLKKMRKDRMQEKLFAYTIQNNSKIVYGDQDVINSVLQTKIKYLPNKYNAQVGPYTMSDEYNKLAKKGEATIIHLIGAAKPWVPSSLSPFVDEYYHLLALSPLGANSEKEYKKIKKSNRHESTISTLRKIIPQPTKKVLRRIINAFYSK